MPLTRPDESMINIAVTSGEIDNIESTLSGEIVTVQSNLDTTEADLYTHVEEQILGKYITGLEISNGTDTEHDINIAPGFCKDSTGNHLLELTSGLTKQLDA